MNKLATLFRQYSPARAIGLFCLDILRRLLDRHRFTTYSQTGEDRIIDFLLRGRDKVAIYYVDIGCNQPSRWSNTMRLYQGGACGLAIDGNQACINRFKRVRPRDIAVCACVSDQTDGVIFKMHEDDALSQVVEEPSDPGNAGSPISSGVPFRTAASIFEECGVPTAFDLLSIDVEGHELSVLRSCDFDRFRPMVIVVEIHNKGEPLENVIGCKIVRHLATVGYELRYYATMNAYFVSAGSNSAAISAVDVGEPS